MYVFDITNILVIYHTKITKNASASLPLLKPIVKKNAQIARNARPPPTKST